MKPPSDVPPSELFLKLMELPRPTEVIDFPRKGLDGLPVGKIRVQVLTQEEHDRARLAGHRSMKGQGFDKEDFQGVAIQEVLGDTVARELLAMACLTEKGPEDDNGTPMYGRIFRDAEDLKKLRSDEIAVLFSSYMTIQAKFGPFESNVETEEDTNAWIKRLVEGGSALPLAVLPSPAVQTLSFSLAVRLCSLYGLLASQRSSLPPILESNLDKFLSDTGFSFEQPASTEKISGENSTST